MRKWLSGGAIAVATAVGSYLLVSYCSKPKPPAPPAVADAPAATPDAAAPPAMLAEVVDVTDIGPLLDPPPPHTEPLSTGPVVTAVGMEPTGKPVQPVSAAAPIPPAVDE